MGNGPDFSSLEPRQFDGPQEPASTETPQPQPEKYPFWSYADLVVFFGLAFPCLLLGAFLVKVFLWVFHLRVHSIALELVPAQFVGYGLLFFALYLLLKLHYQRPFWLSLKWVPTRPGVSRLEAPHAVGVELALPEPVRGPLALGALCHFGLGLFLPRDD